MCAFVLARSGIYFRSNLCLLSDLENDLRRLRFHLQTAVTNKDIGGETASVQAAQKVLHQIYSRVFGALSVLVPEDTRQITIVPHGPLHRIPFHALHDGTGYVSDKWEVTTAPSAVLWNALQTRRGTLDTASALLMGIPDPGIGQVTEEIERIGRILPGATAFCGSEATLGAFYQYAPHKRILHLATHGLFRKDNPLFSGLRFSDGWLLARDLYGICLDADLVTLSACQTGVVDVAPGEELFGLVRGFLAAGARTLVVSLWTADDAATALLMTHFYTLLQAGERPAAALRTAQGELRRRCPHPYYWAPFVVIGAP